MDILLHDETQLLAWGEGRAVGPWIKLRLSDPELLSIFRGMDTATEKRSGHILHVTIARGDIAELVQAEEPEAHQYGEEAKALRQSGFFRTPAVWRQIGSDADYLAWLRTQHCAYCGAETGIEAAHVRRVADGAGTGIKPEYAAIPLCREHHRLQHDRGESAVGGKEWCDKQRIQHVEQWAWEALKARLGCDHWYDVPPATLRLWAVDNGVSGSLPQVYREPESSDKTVVILDGVSGSPPRVYREVRNAKT